MKYRAKPCEIEAIQFMGGNLKEIEEFAKGKCVGAKFRGSLCIGLTIESPKGWMSAKVRDYILKVSSDEFYVLTSDVFEKKYELIK